MKWFIRIHKEVEEFTVHDILQTVWFHILVLGRVSCVHLTVCPSEYVWDLLPADKKKRKSEDGLAGGNEDSQQNQHIQIDSVHLTYQFYMFLCCSCSYWKLKFM